MILNRTALSVIGLAIGAVLIIGLYNIYKPKINTTTHDVFDKIHIGKLEPGGRPGTGENWNDGKEHKWGSVYYKDHGNGNIEVTRGAIYGGWCSTNTFWSGRDLKGQRAPADMANATHITFDHVDVTPARSLNAMFWGDTKLQSVNFGDDFDTRNIQTADTKGGQWGMASMFQDDPNLENVNFGKKYVVEPGTADTELGNMFYGDHKLQTPTGTNDPHIMRVYQHNVQPNDTGYPMPA